MTIVAQKFKILSKRTVRGSALVTFSDTKQGFTVQEGKQKCMEKGLWNICQLLYVFIVIVLTTNLFLSTQNEKYTLPLHGRQWIQVPWQIDSIRYNTKLLKKLLDRLDTKECKDSDFLSILYSKPLREFRKPSLKLETEFESQSMTYPSGRVISHSVHKRFSKLLKFLPENLQHTQ